MVSKPARSAGFTVQPPLRHSPGRSLKGCKNTARGEAPGMKGEIETGDILFLSHDLGRCCCFLAGIEDPREITRVSLRRVLPPLSIRSLSPFP